MYVRCASALRQVRDVAELQDLGEGWRGVATRAQSLRMYITKYMTYDVHIIHASL